MQYININRKLSHTNKIKIDSSQCKGVLHIEKLLEDYRNVIYGDKKYKGKIYTIIGKVSEINIKDDNIELNMNSEKYFADNIYCYFENGKDLEQYKIGSDIKVMGIVLGKDLYITMDDCVCIKK